MSDHVVAVFSAPPISRLSDLMMSCFRIFGARLFGDSAVRWFSATLRWFGATVRWFGATVRRFFASGWE
jgi:hypothetical protein